MSPGRLGPCFADDVWHGAVTVAENVRLARDTYRLRFACPEIARRILPGQFIMLRLSGYDDPLLGRPLALYDMVLSSSSEPTGLDIVYLVVGKLTGKLAQLRPDTRLEVWGPLGNGFAPTPTEHLVMVAGGIGQTPFPAVAQEFFGLKRFGHPPRVVAPAHKITLCYGARTANLLAGIDDFERLGVDVHVSTDDGTAGHNGLVTDLLQRVLEHASPSSTRIVCCGPEQMMHAVAKIAQQRGISCEVSLESPMACGIGICFSCVAKVRQADGTWDYRRTCVEGPVFDAEEIEF